jgi:hypothetical protein
MGNAAEVVFAGNAKGLLDEYKKLEKANEQLSQKLLAAMKVSKQAANEEKKLRQEVTQAIEKSRTPAEAYIQTINRYKQALQAGMITAEQFNRIRDKELQKLNATKSATENLTNAQKVAKSVTVESTKTNELLTFSFGAIAGAVAAATRGLQAFNLEQQRIQQESSMTVESMDAMARQYAVQAGIGEGEVNTYRDKILAQAKKNAVLPEKAFPAAIQLESSGFVGAVDSGTLDSFLKILSTSNQKMNDPKAIAMAMSQFMAAYKMEKTKGNMLEIGSRMKGLMDTDLEMSDLSNFAKAAPGMAEAGIPLGEALSIMTSLRATMDPAEAAIGVRNVVSFMQTAKNNKTQQKVLKTLGLNSTDIDVVGETATEAMTRFRDALMKQPKENQTPLMEDMFGRENFNKAFIIFNGLKDLPKYTAAQGNVKSFVEGVNLNQQGPDANRIRQSIGMQQAQLINDDTVAVRQYAIRKREIGYQEEMAKIDANPNSNAFTKNIAKGLMFAGSAIQSTLIDPFQQPEDFYGGIDSVRQSIQRERGAAFTEQDLRGRMNGGQAGSQPMENAIKEQTAVLKSIDAKLTPSAKPTENPNLQGRVK